MIPVLVDGVKKYLLTEEEVDAKINASGGSSSSETDYMKKLYFFGDNYSHLPIDKKYINSAAIAYKSESGSTVLLGLYYCRPYGDTVEWFQDNQWQAQMQ